MYKRQGQYHRGKHTEYQFQKSHIHGVPNDGTRLWGRKEIDKMLESVIAVSYTHLDVYKRQATCRYAEENQILLLIS